VDLSAYAELAVRLANAAADCERETARGDHEDSISGLDGLRALLTAQQFPDTRATRTDLDAMQALRIEFRRIFTACAEGNEAEAVDRLNTLLIRHPVHPQITGHDDQPWHLHLTQGGSVADRYAAASSMGLATALTQRGAGRLKVCAAPGCPGVFIDSTPGRSGHYCSRRCSPEASVTTLRARRKPRQREVPPTAAV
jgi:predicted RNA-binding Zn ribbon-like protein